MGIFEKKCCDICGERLGRSEDRRLQNGHLCRSCEKKLSPWCPDLRSCTLEQIRLQLRLREENLQELEQFHCTARYGEACQVLVDERRGWFLITEARSRAELLAENPDIFRLDQVREAALKVADTRKELYRKTEDGRSLPWEPARYRYSCRFYLTVRLDHPWLRELEFQLNDCPVEIDCGEETEAFPGRDFEYRRFQAIGREIVRVLQSGVREPQGA